MNLNESLETNVDLCKLLNSSTLTLDLHISSEAIKAQLPCEKHWKLIWIYSNCLIQRGMQLAARSPCLVKKYGMARSETLETIVNLVKLLSNSRWGPCHKMNNLAEIPRWHWKNHWKPMWFTQSAQLEISTLLPHHLFGEKYSINVWKLMWIYSKCLTQLGRYMSAMSPFLASGTDRNFWNGCGLRKNASEFEMRTSAIYQ